LSTSLQVIIVIVDFKVTIIIPYIIGYMASGGLAGRFYNYQDWIFRHHAKDPGYHTYTDPAAGATQGGIGG
jgi:hypothetical protein